MNIWMTVNPLEKKPVPIRFHAQNEMQVMVPKVLDMEIIGG